MEETIKFGLRHIKGFSFRFGSNYIKTTKTKKLVGKINIMLSLSRTAERSFSLVHLSLFKL